MRTLALYRFAAIGGLCLVFFLAGCASPGPPRAPSLRLPELASGLVAERRGDAVRLRWTTPSKSTDGLVLGRGVTAQVCRQVVGGASGGGKTCAAVHRIAVTPGASEWTDALPATLTRGAGAVLEYRVELLNANERSAGLSPGALAAGGPAPPPVSDLRVEVMREGALLRWKPEDAGDGIELDRMLVGSGEVAKKSGEQDGSSAKTPAEVRLRVGRDGAGDVPFRADAGGTVDATARRGESFIYTAERVRRVVLEGHALELRSAVSPAVRVTMTDTFAPRAPRGLEATAGELAGAWGIDLSWEPNTEEDLAGYLVYRQEGDGPVIVLPLTPTPVAEPGFRDTRVVPGRSYLYTVVAVDLSGNRSTPSAPAREEIRMP